MDWIVSQNESGTSLITFLKSKFPDFSAKRLKKEIDSNHVLVNGRVERFSSFNLGTGDRIVLLLEEITELSKMNFERARILYDDNDYIIYDKPSGIASDDPTFLAMLQEKWAAIALCHRLDKDTTGTLILSKNQPAFKAMAALFKERRVEKSYLAITDGIFESTYGVIDNHLGPIKKIQGQTIWGKVKENGLHAITEWQVETKGNHASLVRCHPKTGRTHQIRTHLSSISHPILGDYQYGRHFTCPYRPLRVLLHSEQIAFDHFKTGKRVIAIAPLPEDFNQAIQALFQS